MSALESLLFIWQTCASLPTILFVDASVHTPLFVCMCFCLQPCLTGYNEQYAERITRAHRSWNSSVSYLLSWVKLILGDFYIFSPNAKQISGFIKYLLHSMGSSWDRYESIRPHTENRFGKNIYLSKFIKMQDSRIKFPNFGVSFLSFKRYLFIPWHSHLWTIVQLGQSKSWTLK